jgi:hypothetical protein
MNFAKGLFVNGSTKTLLNNYLVKLSQAVASNMSDDSELFIYNDKNCDTVFEMYEKIKNDIKDSVSKNTFLADRHKIASIFIYSIIKNRPIKTKANSTDISDIDLEIIPNIYLAVVFAIYIMESFYEEKYKKELKMSFPKEDGSSNYKEQFFALIKLLCNDIDSANCDKTILLSLSHILFLLEENSK